MDYLDGYLNLPTTWQMCNRIVKFCKQGPEGLTRFRRNPPASMQTPRRFNYLVQINFIESLHNFSDKYVCTVVDVHSGLGYARKSNKPDQAATILTLWNWCACYDTNNNVLRPRHSLHRSSDQESCRIP